MSIVRKNILKVIQRIDPSMSDGVEITDVNIETWKANGSDRFTAQRILDCYNDARKALASALVTKYLAEREMTSISDITLTNDAFEFRDHEAQKDEVNCPGFILSISLHIISNDFEVAIVPGHLYAKIKELDSAHNFIVFEYADKFVPAVVADIPDGSNYQFRYIGVIDWTMAQATSASQSETFNSTMDSLLIELACAIADEQGAAAVNAMAIKFVGGGK